MGAGRGKKAVESGEGDGGVRKRLFMRGRKNKVEGVDGGGWRKRLLLLVMLGRMKVGGGENSSLMVD